MVSFEDTLNAIIKQQIEKVVSDLEEKNKLSSSNLLGLISKDKLLEQLEISYSTLRRCEHAGLRRYPLPLDGSRNIYYKIDDVVDFICKQ